jgi:outer membrane lipoprotein LolB
VRRLPGIGLLLGMSLLAGCAQLAGPPPARAVPIAAGEAPPPFRLAGRVSVKSAEQSFSGGLRWAHEDAADEILLNSPLGQGVAELRRRGGRVTLTDAEGRQREADSGEALLEAALGVSLPLEGLVYWLHARPRPGGAYNLEEDASGRVTRMEQDGWRIEYDRYQPRGDRWQPGRIFAQRGEGLEFRLVVDTWETP